MEENEIFDLAQETGKIILGERTVQPKLPDLCRKAAGEGIVLLKNDGTLPFSQGQKVSLFGRVQKDYFYVGYGSGGDVNPPYQVSLLQGLRESKKIQVNEILAEIYEEWCDKHPIKEAEWGNWPRYHEEMPISEDEIKNAAQVSDIAVVVLGRAAGEDRENNLEEGSFYLTKDEKSLLSQVTETFVKTVVVIDTGNIIDFSWMKEYEGNISAVVLAWQGGMESGHALADILCGERTPSGKLTDTIAHNYSDYPTADNFGHPDFNNYVEDVYVGYRYFETFAREKVMYPFGYGLSYTDFKIQTKSFQYAANITEITIEVENIGSEYSGAEVIQIYVKAPQGKLGKPSMQLVAFEKTGQLLPGTKQTMSVVIPLEKVASFDDSGVTGYKSAYVLEAGNYEFYVGNSVRNTECAGKVEVIETKLVKQLKETSAVEEKNTFSRMKAVESSEGVALTMEQVPAKTVSRKEIIEKKMPDAIKQTGDKGYKLADVKNGKVTMEKFVAQLDVAELEAISRGEGRMDSTLGTKGNAGTFGGVTASLREKGIPAITTTDGPAGIRLAYYASQLPCGTALASSWNTSLIEELGTFVGREMNLKGTDVLLAPGMNIHRDPLCGRNFEYYSEDPLLTGKMAAAMVRGVQTYGLSACPKHFACNNQETRRNVNDSRVSERALREIYLKGFEICIKEAKPHNIMTSYNKVNGVWSHYNYDLATRILREEWGYEGNVITDWWMQPDTDPDFENVTNDAYRIRAQVDVLMPGGVTFECGDSDGSLLDSYEKNGITLGEMQRSAMNVLKFAIKKCRNGE